MHAGHAEPEVMHDGCNGPEIMLLYMTHQSQFPLKKHSAHE